MQVTQVSDHVTHAIIGGQQTQAFSIAQTAEFFNVLSSSLYSRKEEAVVREVLCNAWDAHIDSGREHIAVQVTLTNNKLIIRDFGEGISPEMMQVVYCTYGGSTKTSDTKTTGGFGLGSKSPFAYVDHFQTTSNHKGTKTIYRASLSSAVVRGEPGLTPIVSTPTTESGMEVSIDIKNNSDYIKFKNLVTKFAALGNMKVTLNDKEIERIPFEKAKDGYLIAQHTEVYNDSPYVNYIKIRYGNVVYPIEQHSEYASLHDEVASFLGVISGTLSWNSRPEYTLILQAEPDSISVTPSRESLSMTDHTVTTIKRLLTNFLDKAVKSFEETCIKTNNKLIEETWLNGNPAILFKLNTVPFNKFNHKDFKLKKIMTDVTETADKYMFDHYPKFPGYAEADFIKRLGTFVEHGYGCTHIAKSLLNEVSNHSSSTRTDWFHKKFLLPIVKKILKNPKMDIERLLVYDRGATATKWGGVSNDSGFTQATKFPRKELTHYLPYIRGIVVLTHNRLEVVGRLKQMPDMRHWWGKPEGVFFYVVPRVTTKMEEAREFWKNMGMTVIDLTVAHKWEPKDIVEPAPRNKNPKPKHIGIPLLSRIFNGTRINTVNAYIDSTENRIELPEYVIKIPNKSENFRHVLNMSEEASRALVNLFGTKTGIVSNSTQEDKFVSLGAKKLEANLPDILLNEYKTNPAIRMYYEHNTRHRPGMTYQFNDLINVIYLDPILRKQYGIPDVSNDTLNYVLINESTHGYARRSNPIYMKIDTLIASWKLAPNLQGLREKIQISEVFPLISISMLKTVLNPDSQYKESLRQTYRDMLSLAMEG